MRQKELVYMVARWFVGFDAQGKTDCYDETSRDAL